MLYNFSVRIYFGYYGGLGPWCLTKISGVVIWVCCLNDFSYIGVLEEYRWHRSYLSLEATCILVQSEELFFFNTFVFLGFSVHKKCWLLWLICSMFCALISCIKFLKRPTNSLECMNVSLLYSSHWHVLATHLYNFGYILLNLTTVTWFCSCGFILTNNCNYILVLTTLPATWMAKTYWLVLCDKLTFINSSVYVGLFKNFIQ